jgi:hypothetical protein
MSAVFFIPMPSFHPGTTAPHGAAALPGQFITTGTHSVERKNGEHPSCHRFRPGPPDENVRGNLLRAGLSSVTFSLPGRTVGAEAPRGSFVLFYTRKIHISNVISICCKHNLSQTMAEAVATQK